MRNPADCQHKMLARPLWLRSKMQTSLPWLWSIWWQARRGSGHFGGEPTVTTVKMATSPLRARSIWFQSHLPTSPANLKGWQARRTVVKKNEPAVTAPKNAGKPATVKNAGEPALTMVNPIKEKNDVISTLLHSLCAKEHTERLINRISLFLQWNQQIIYYFLVN